MNKFAILLKGDESRMRKYGITYASLVVTILWIVLIQLLAVDNIDKIFPLFIFIDATMMSFLLVGVSMMFEKQESALKTMLVTPISKHYYLVSKITVTIISSLLTLLLLGAYGVIFKNLSINFLGIIAAVILATFIYACIGILFTYKSKDFTILLMWLMAFFFALAVPTILQMFGIITAEWFRYVQYINPTQSIITVFNATVISVDKTDLIISLSYLIVLAGVLYYFVAKKFDKYSMKELGGE
ncbi:MAG: ABC transporter permease [Vulcanibacillus sp.]